MKNRNGSSLNGIARRVGVRCAVHSLILMLKTGKIEIRLELVSYHDQL